MLNFTLTRQQWYAVCDRLEAFNAPYELLLSDYIWLVMGGAGSEITLYFRQHDHSILLPIVAEIACHKDA